MNFVAYAWQLRKNPGPDVSSFPSRLPILHIRHERHETMGDSKLVMS
jgi:hypothetical protein